MEEEYHLACDKFDRAESKEERLKAIAKIRALADMDCLKAQVKMGLIYMRGGYIMNDYKEASIWLLRAANHGHPIAQALYGSILIVDKSIPGNKEESLKCREKSAAQNCVYGILSLAYYYQNEKNDKKEFEMLEKALLKLSDPEDDWFIYCYMIQKNSDDKKYKAIDFCIRAANGNIPSAQNSLALHYKKGHVKCKLECKECKCHITWFEKAAKNGDYHGIGNFGFELILNGNIHEGIRWLELGSRRGNDFCDLLLGQIYDPGLYNDISITKNVVIAINYYTISAEGGNLTSCIRLTENYINVEDYEKAIFYATKYLNSKRKNLQNENLMKYYVAYCKYNTKNTPEDHKLGMMEMIKLADAGYAKSQEFLSSHYLELKDFQNYIHWAQKAADNNRHIPMQNLAMSYLIGGQGVKIDKEMGIDLLTRAAELGNTDAKLNLGLIYSTRPKLSENYKVPSAKKSIYWFRKAANDNFAPAYFHLAMEIDEYLEYANIESIERDLLNKEATSWLAKAIKSDEDTICQEDIDEIRIYINTTEIKKLTRHQNIGPIDVIISKKPMKLSDLIRQRLLSLIEIKHIGRQMCLVLVHFQENGIAIPLSYLSYFYILPPRAHEIREMYISRLIKFFPRVVGTLIADYLATRLNNVSNLTTDFVIASRIVLFDYDIFTSTSESSLAKNMIVREHEAKVKIFDMFDISNLAPEARHSCEHINSYTLGILLGMLISDSHVDDSINCLVIGLLRRDVKRRSTLEHALKILSD